MKPIVVGVAGTAKNTGKTTTIAALMKEIRKHGGLKLALSSIGYDGEELDNITGLPKPRINVWPGIIVAVAEQCLKASKIESELLYKTDIRTPLGKIIVARVRSEGLLLMAGPNKAKELSLVLELFTEQGANITIVDGALNRIAPMVKTDGLVICTGAARNTDIRQLAEEIKIINGFFHLSVLEVPAQTAAFSNALEIDQVQKIIDELHQRKAVLIKGIMSQKCLEYLFDNVNDLNEKHLIFSDPIKLMLSGEMGRNAEIFAGLVQKGVTLGLVKKLRLFAVTVNPYYPRYRISGGHYEAAYIDHAQLYNAVKEKSKVPVYDIAKSGAAKLFHNLIDVDIN